MDGNFGEWVVSMGVASGWNLWVWLECIGVVNEWCCKEVYIIIDILIIIITFPYSACISSFFCRIIPFSLLIFKMSML